MNAGIVIGEVIEQLTKVVLKKVGGKTMGRFNDKVEKFLAGDGSLKKAGRTVWNNKAMLIGGTYFGVKGYREARERGEGVLSSLAQASEDAVIPELVGPGKYIMALLASAAPEALVGAYEKSGDFARSLARTANMPFATATFQDSPVIATMRQAGMEIAKTSKVNLQQTIGNEARQMHS